MLKVYIEPVSFSRKGARAALNTFTVLSTLLKGRFVMSLLCARL